MLTTTMVTFDQIDILNTLESDRTADEELARRVFLFLSTRQVGDLRRLAVTARDGRVRLSGRVSSFYHRQLAVSFARKVAGVLTVDDQITVLVPARKSRSTVRVSTELLSQSA